MTRATLTVRKTASISVVRFPLRHFSGVGATTLIIAMTSIATMTRVTSRLKVSDGAVSREKEKSLRHINEVAKYNLRFSPLMAKRCRINLMSTGEPVENESTTSFRGQLEEERRDDCPKRQGKILATTRKISSRFRPSFYCSYEDHGEYLLPYDVYDNEKHRGYFRELREQRDSIRYCQ